MSAFVVLLVLAVIFNGLLAGTSFDTALVKLPARRRIGARAYAVFARGNDLGNGLILYPALAILASLLVFATLAFAFINQQPGRHVLLWVASVASVLHFVATSQAAPQMIGLRKAPDDEDTLMARLNTFARWHAVRTVLQCLTFLILVWVITRVH
ncbi:MAG: hypothetical protein ABSG63_14315 [Spirochaetia bacterium]